MQIDLINQIYIENRNEFTKPELTTRHDGLLMVSEGSCTISADGNREQVLSRHDIAFIPAGTHYVRHIKEIATIYLLSFTSQEDHPFRLSMPTGRLSLPESVRDVIFNSFSRAFIFPDNRELLVHAIEHIFVENYILGEGTRVSMRHISDEVKSTVRYMNENLAGRIDMDDLAARVYLSHTGLIWKFKQELGTTPSQYLIMLRQRYAKQLLLDHDYSVTEVAYLCGYSNPYYFTNAFRRHTSLSPTAFRKKHRV